MQSPAERRHSMRGAGTLCLIFSFLLGLLALLPHYAPTIRIIFWSLVLGAVILLVVGLWSLASVRHLPASPEPANSPDLAKKPVEASKAEIIELAQKMAGGWPVELLPGVIEKIDFEKLLSIFTRYQNMAHPGSGGSVFPQYKIVSGTVARVCDPLQDIKIVMKAAHIQRSRLLRDDTVRLAWEVIQYYAGIRLAKFLFFLPRASKMNEERNIILMEDWYIDVLKGIENVLFEIYEELGEGQLFADEIVIEKLIGLVKAAQQ